MLKTCNSTSAFRFAANCGAQFILVAVLWLTLPLCSTGAWADGPQDNSRARGNAERWKSLDENRREKMRELHRRIEKLSPEKRKELFDRLRSLSEEQRRGSVRRAKKHIGKDPAERRMHDERRSTLRGYWGRLSDDERRKLRALPHDERFEAMRQRMKKRRSELLAELPEEIRPAATKLDESDQVHFLREYRSVEAAMRTFRIDAEVKTMRELPSREVVTALLPRPPFGRSRNPENWRGRNAEDRRIRHAEDRRSRHAEDRRSRGAEDRHEGGRRERGRDGMKRESSRHDDNGARRRGERENGKAERARRDPADDRRGPPGRPSRPPKDSPEHRDRSGPDEHTGPRERPEGSRGPRDARHGPPSGQQGSRGSRSGPPRVRPSGDSSAPMPSRPGFLSEETWNRWIALATYERPRVLFRILHSKTWPLERPGPEDFRGSAPSRPSKFRPPHRGPRGDARRGGRSPGMGRKPGARGDHRGDPPRRDLEESRERPIRGKSKTSREF